MKILYVNHNPWNFVLQRSQIIALELEKRHNCIVLDKNYIPATKRNLSNTNPKCLIKVPQLRGGGKFRIVDAINTLMFNIYCRLHAKVDAIWICFPTYVNGVPSNFKGKVVYDCMDNHVAMAPDKKKNYVSKKERALIDRADLIFVSAQHLKTVNKGLEKAVLVRNGFISGIRNDVKCALKKNAYTIGYFGAIESWFDFELLENSHVFFKNIDYRLIGPVKNTLVNESKRWEELNIHFEGLVKHDNLADYVKKYDALVMPFVVNDIILSVDPVKLYEYISFGKCVISVWYPEIERFRPYVYFYRNQQEFFDLLRTLSEKGFPAKYSQEQQIAFLEENSWEKRCDIINAELERVVYGDC